MCTLFSVSPLRSPHFVYPEKALAASDGVLLTVMVNASSSSATSTSSGEGTQNTGGGGGGGGGIVAVTPFVILAQKPVISGRADVNGDGVINLADFSILAYWFKRPLTNAVKEQVDLNGDGKVDLVDLSILAYYWRK